MIKIKRRDQDQKICKVQKNTLKKIDNTKHANFHVKTQFFKQQMENITLTVKILSTVDGEFFGGEECKHCGC